MVIDIVKYVVDLFLHLDVHLNSLVITMGPWLYLLLFAVIFCETGLVVTPILPGDSLLFAAGALAAIDGSPLNLALLAILLIIAGILGDAVNYALGRRFGSKVFTSDDSRFFKRKYLVETQNFYDKHGGKTIILARYMPIVRTFAPFVAGIGNMGYRSFALFNVIGAVSWVLLFLLGGFFLGNLPAVQKNFHIVILAVIVISVIPGLIEWYRARKRKVNETSAMSSSKLPH